MQRILIRRGNALYRLIAFEFRDHADGSFYIEFKTAEREGTPAKREKISYHATGRIKFSGPLDHVIFGDPIFALAEPREIACISLHDLDALQQVTGVRADDKIFEVQDCDRRRINLHLIIGPDNDALPIEKALTITYPGWFRFHLDPGAPLPIEITEGTSRIFAGPSRYERQRVEQSQALIFFHQKRTMAKGSMFFWDSKARVGRLIFSVPMRIPPALKIEFIDPALVAEPQPAVVLNTATAELRFKVRGPSGYLSEMPPYKSIALDAEL